MESKTNLPFIFMAFFFYLSGTFAQTNFIKKSCANVTCPSLCERSLSPYAETIKTNSATLTRTALVVTLKRSLSTQAYLNTLNRLNGLKLGERLVIRDCLEQMTRNLLSVKDSIKKFKTFEHAKGPDFSLHMSDVNIWISGAMADVDTCMDSFGGRGMRDKIRSSLGSQMTSLWNVTSNALDLVYFFAQKHSFTEDLSSALKTTNVFSTTNEKRKLEFPNWVNPGDKKLLQTISPKADIVVAQDGSGNFKTIKDALDAAITNKSSSGRLVIYIKTGVYAENIEIAVTLENLMLVGDGANSTIITGNRSSGTDGYKTFNSSTVIVSGPGFIARGIKFRNTAGPHSQAVALLSASDKSVFFRCDFEGYQDTLCIHQHRQFYRECSISGTIDFIFGFGSAVFQNCMIYCRGVAGQQVITITAQGRDNPKQKTGIIIQSSRILAAPHLIPMLGSVKVYLGRPWRKYSRTVFLENYMDSLVDPAGWLPWDAKTDLNAMYYGEYKNSGPGSSTTQRVKWGGYHVITNDTEAIQFTVTKFLRGDTWLPDTGVPFQGGLKFESKLQEFSNPISLKNREFSQAYYI